jgi:hypothetical protein
VYARAGRKPHQARLVDAFLHNQPNARIGSMPTDPGVWHFRVQENFQEHGPLTRGDDSLQDYSTLPGFRIFGRGDKKMVFHDPFEQAGNGPETSSDSLPCADWSTSRLLARVSAVKQIPTDTIHA